MNNQSKKSQGKSDVKFEMGIPKTPTVEEGKERLDKIQAELQRRGVTDVKFVWHPNLHKLKEGHVYNEVADFMEAYLEGKVKALHTVGDSKDQAHSVDVLCEWIESFAENATGHFVSEASARDFIRQLRNYIELEGFVGKVPDAK